MLNLIGLLDRPTHGSYLFEGIDTSYLEEGQRAGLRSRRIGFVFQSFHLLAHRSVIENVMLSTIYNGMPRADRVPGRGDSAHPGGLEPTDGLHADQALRW